MHARVSDSRQHVHEIKPVPTRRSTWFSAHLSLLPPPPFYHKFTPVLSFASSILSHFHFPPLSLFWLGVPFLRLKPALHLCALTFEQKVSGHHKKKALKSSFPPTCWLTAHINNRRLTATVHLLFSLFILRTKLQGPGQGSIPAAEAQHRLLHLLIRAKETTDRTSKNRGVNMAHPLLHTHSCQ